MTKKGDGLQQEALDAPRQTLADLAKALRLSRPALASYRARQREMPSTVRRRLATYLRKHAGELKEIADRLSS